MDGTDGTPSVSPTSTCFPSIFVGESFKNEDLTNCQTNTRGGWMKIPAVHVVNWKLFGLMDRRSEK